MKESGLVTKIRKAVLNEGHLPTKVHGGQYSVGVSDLLVCVRGRFVALEVKSPGKERNVTQLQANYIRRVRRAGGIAWVVSSVEAALEVCEKLPDATPDQELTYECSP